jgi:exodeoxyribonuclease VII small subunit
MADERYTFEQARLRLEEIAAEVRKKDTSLEKSLDLLEEGVRLANICTDLVDHTDLSAPGVTAEGDEGLPAETGTAALDGASVSSDAAITGQDGADDGPASAEDVDGGEDVPAPAAPARDADDVRE